MVVTTYASMYACVYSKAHMFVYVSMALPKYACAYTKVSMRVCVFRYVFTYVCSLQSYYIFSCMSVLVIVVKFVAMCV